MSGSLTFTVIRDTATPAVQNARVSLNGPGAKRAVGRSIFKLVREHLRALPPNEQFPQATTGFYKSAAESVTAPQVDSAGVTVAITQVGMRQRYFGGTITPTNAKMLTIPAREEAYGHRASEFNLKLEELGVGPTGRPILALVQADVQAIRYRKTKNGTRIAQGPVTGGGVMFWLVPSVTQQADPGVLPTEDELAEASMAGLRFYVRARLHDRNATFAVSNLISDGGDE